MDPWRHADKRRFLHKSHEAEAAGERILTQQRDTVLYNCRNFSARRTIESYLALFVIMADSFDQLDVTM